MSLVYAVHVPNAPHLIQPSVFGGQGAETVTRLRELRLAERHRPDALLVVSPHWVARRQFRVHVGARPRQVFDFTGFPEALYQVRYEPPGDPALARALLAEGKDRGLPVEGTEEWGLDHGAWAPLVSLAPGARLPVVPLSISTLSSAEHVAWGEAVGAVAERSPKRLALVSTGSILHSFSRFDPSRSEPWEEGAALEREVVDRAVERRTDDLLKFDPRKWALLEPEGNLSPLFVLLGALGPGFRGRLVGTSQLNGAFGLSVLEFVPA